MSHNESGATLEMLNEFESCSSYQSYIRFYGRSIIPPLLTKHQREKIFQIRQIAAEKENYILLKRKHKNELSSKVKEVFRKVEEILDDSASEDKSTLCWKPNSSRALFSSASESHSSWLSNPSETTSTDLAKSSPSDLCSSLDDNNLRCKDFPNVINSSNPSSSSIDKFSNYSVDIQNQDSSQSISVPFTESEVPEEFAHRTYNISDDDQGSVTEETEFESLPTVICAKKQVAQDTDNESVETHVTQSTDLEKYLNLSMEFSSSEDYLTGSDDRYGCQMKTNSNSRSEGASSETIINSGSDPMLCISAMVGLNDCLDGQLLAESHSKDLVTDQAVNINNRAHSVDSYMNICRNTTNLNIKKSHCSEPSDSVSGKSVDFSNTTSLNDVSNSSKEEFRHVNQTPDSDSTSLNPDFDSKLIANIGSNELPCSSSALQKIKLNLDLLSTIDNLACVSEDAEFHSKGHSRRGSYTLDHPSPVLIKAHEDCNCNFAIEDCSPHSCAMGWMNSPSPNSAFKKEKVSVLLPPSPYRDRRFPILKISPLKFSSNGKNTEVCEEEMQNGGMAENIENKSVGVSEESSEKIGGNEKELLLDMGSENVESIQGKKDSDQKSSPNKVDFQKIETQVFLNQMFHELQENHKDRINKLLEEQNRQWLRLQDEYKEQERLLCEKFQTLETLSTEDDMKISPNAQPNSNFLKNDLEYGVLENENSLTRSLNVDQNKESKICISLPVLDKSPLSNLSVPQQLQTSDIYSKYLLKSSSSEKDCDIPNLVDKNECGDNIDLVYLSEKEWNDLIKCQADVPAPSCSNCDFTSLCKDHSVPFNSRWSQCSSPVEYYLNDLGKVPPVINCITPDNEVFEVMDTRKTDFNINNVESGSDQNVNSEQVLVKSSTCHMSNPTQNAIEVNVKINCDSSAENIQLSSATSPRIKQQSMISFNNDSTLVTYRPKRTVSESSTSIHVPAKPHSSSVSVDSFPCYQPRAPKQILCSSLTNLKRRQSKDLIKDPVLLKKFDKLPALVKGYLTRRLMKTEKVQELKKTLQDTATLITKLNAEHSSKGDSVSETDITLYRQLIVQLMTTFDTLYDILCTMSINEKMKIISESRNLILKKLAAEKAKNLPISPVVAEKAEFFASKRLKLSSGTVKALERKKNIVENKSYAVDDMKSYRSRANSSSSSKSQASSPARLNRTSIAVPLKRSSKSVQTQHWR